MKKIAPFFYLFFFMLPFLGFGQKQPPLFTVYKNQLKIGVQEIFMGDLSVYYERILTKKIAVEFGSGVVLRNSLILFWEAAALCINEVTQPNEVTGKVN